MTSKMLSASVSASNYSISVSGERMLDGLLFFSGYSFVLHGIMTHMQVVVAL